MLFPLHTVRKVQGLVDFLHTTPLAAGGLSGHSPLFPRHAASSMHKDVVFLHKVPCDLV